MKLAGIIVCVGIATGCGRAPDRSPGVGSGSAGSAQPSTATNLAKSPPPAPPAKPRQPVDDLIDAADQMLFVSVALDYRRPMQGWPYDREPVRKAFYQACKAGDPRSCWMVREVERGLQDPKPLPYEADAVARIVESCRAGDRLSCSAMAPGDLQDIDVLPGHYARNQDCAAFSTCNLDGLSRECRDGYADSCVKLRELQPIDRDRTAVTEAAKRLTDEGCHAGIVRDCRSAARLFGDAANEADRAKLVSVREQLCTIGLVCSELGHLYLQKDPERAQIALERDCQLNGACEDVWRAYTSHPPAIREPVPGRAAKLRSWACKVDKTCW